MKIFNFFGILFFRMHGYALCNVFAFLKFHKTSEVLKLEFEVFSKLLEVLKHVDIRSVLRALDPGMGKSGSCYIYSG